MTEEVKPGYKRTEIGVIPEDWDFNSIESVTPIGGQNGIVDGPFGSNLKTIHYRKSGIPIITSGYVTTGKFEANEYLYVDKKKFEEEKRSAVKAGDIVMAKIGARCGSSAILPHHHPIGILSGNALKITVDQTRHSTFYIWKVLWDLYSGGRIDELKTVGAQPAISMANLKKYKIQLPQLTEQHAIESALSDMDALISSQDQLIAKKRDIQQAAMQQLITGQRRLPGFTDSWPKKRLGEIATLYQPETISQSIFTEGGYPVFGANGVIGSFSRYNHENPQITISCRGNCGTVNKTPPQSWITGNAMVVSIEGRQNIYFDFIYHLLKSKDFSSIVTGSGQPQIVRGPLADFEISMPSGVDEQIAIASILSDMDTELATLEARREKACQLKQGMMQELLTGRTRLI